MINAKQSNILSQVRMEIVGGKYPPGSKLPTRDDLQLRFNASRQTVQLAMNSLIRDGFVCTNRSGGTVVAENPPHLNHYGLVSGIPFSGSRFAMAFQQAAQKIAGGGPMKFSSYCYDGGHIQSEGYRRLMSDVEAHRVAGLIFIAPPYHLERTPVLEQKDLPRVAICDPECYPDLCHMNLNCRNFIERAVEHLMKKGRRKIALIGAYINRWAVEEDTAYLEKKGVGRGMWVQACSPDYPWSAHQAAMLLMGISEKNRPDALIIRDDHLVEAATEGLLHSGVRVPQNLEVVAHCNFPDRSPSSVPVTRLGMDCQDVLARSIRCLVAQREKKKFQKDTDIRPVFESELPLAVSAINI